MTWKERFVQFSRKAHCFTFLERIYDQCGDFDNFDAHKRDLAKTCCVWPETSVWYNFHGKRTVWPFWREFQASVTNWQLWCSKMRFGQNVLRMTYNFHEKRTVCPFWREFEGSVTILRTLTLTNEKRTVFPFWREFEDSVTILTILTLTNAIWPKRAAHDLQFSWKALCLPVLERIWG